MPALRIVFGLVAFTCESESSPVCEDSAIRNWNGRCGGASPNPCDSRKNWTKLLGCLDSKPSKVREHATSGHLELSEIPPATRCAKSRNPSRLHVRVNGVETDDDLRRFRQSTVGRDNSRKQRHANTPNCDMHGHQGDRLGPSPAKPMPHRDDNIRHKRNEQGFPGEAAVFAYRVQTIAAHAEKCENCTRAKKHRIEGRGRYRKRRKVGIGLQDCDRKSAHVKNNSVHPAAPGARPSR